MPTVAFINAFSNGHTETATFAAIIDGNEFVYQIPGTLNLAEIKAAQFVVMGVPKGNPIELHTSNKYLIEMMEYGASGWVKNAVKNPDDIEELRKVVIDHGNLLIVPDKVTDGMETARKLARAKYGRE